MNRRRLTLSVREYCAISGEREHTVRMDLGANKIPHVLSGRRGLVRILTVPALQRLGVDADSSFVRDALAALDDGVQRDDV